MKFEKQYWWQHLLALPPSKEHEGFKRIYRLITDTTRVRNYKVGKRNELYFRKHETHLTAAFWENFAISEDYCWINTLTNFTHLSLVAEVLNCKWSYEWERKHEGKNKLLDVVISFKTKQKNGVIIIESKNLKKALGEKDRDPNYYLSIEDFDKYDYKYYLYCIDGNVKSEVEAQIKYKDQNVGIITWQELAYVQMSMVNRMNINDHLKSFVKASIYNQFIEKGVIPSGPILSYLKDEPDMFAYLEHGFNREVAEEKLWEIDNSQE